MKLLASTGIDVNVRTVWKFFLSFGLLHRNDINFYKMTRSSINQGEATLFSDWLPN